MCFFYRLIQSDAFLNTSERFVVRLPTLTSTNQYQDHLYVSAKNRRYAIAISPFGSHRKVAIDQNQDALVLEEIIVPSVVPPLTFNGMGKPAYYDKMKPRAIS